MNTTGEVGENTIMANNITGENLKKLVEEGRVIENGAINNCGPIKYDFVLSDEILKSDFNSPVKLSDLTAEEKRLAVIQPGEVVYVLTKERVNIPSNMYMNLSANRSMSEYGVLTLGGFAVDPGYSGKLMFGLYNYSSTPFTLIPGAKLVGGVFFSFNEEETINSEYLEKPRAIDEFPARLISIISKYSPVGLSSLEESIKAIDNQVNALKQELNKSKDELNSLRYLVQETQEQTNRNSRTVKDVSESVADLTKSVQDLKGEVGKLNDSLRQEAELRKSVKNELNESLRQEVEQRKQTINELNDSLKQEADLRKSMEADLDKKVEIASKEVDKKINFIKGATWALTAVVTVIGGLFLAWLKGMLFK